MLSLPEDKALARREASRSRKLAASQDVHNQGANNVMEHLLAWPALAGIMLNHFGGCTVAGFLPIGSEIDPRPLMRALEGRGASLALPCVQAKDTALIFRQWSEGDHLVSEAFGTKAPDPSKPECQPDIILVPGLAFDLSGYRLGYGGGFYDRTLAKLKAEKSGKQVFTIGLGYECQRVENLPIGPYDQALDMIATPAGLFSCAK